ncbi:hypothetical protein AB0I28_05980 [Phytomonospora sp. NPDC050363]|uniref:hypothetical protein n=1 Tax=Phytomonospora sp. NPDC050363 TaxID=3155642 RepID=UPI0033CC261D
MNTVMSIPTAFRPIAPEPTAPPGATLLFHGAAVDDRGRAAAVLTVTAHPLPTAYRASAGILTELVDVMGSKAGARDLRRVDLPCGPAVVGIGVDRHAVGLVATMTATVPDADGRGVLSLVLAVPGARDWAGWCGVMTGVMRGLRFGRGRR